MPANIGAKIGVEGEKEYRAALQNINQQTKELNSEMKLLESSFSAETSAQERAAASVSVLERAVENQTSKVNLLTEKYNREQTELDRLRGEMEKATAEYGENSDEAQKATTEYEKFATQTSKTKTELNKAQTELNGLTKDLEAAKNPTTEESDAVEDVGRNLKDAGKQGSTFGDVLKANVASQAIIGGIKALGSAVRDVARGIASTVTDTVQWADDLATLSTQTGISTDRLQEFEYMANLVDVDVSTVTGSLSRMVRNMGNAAGGTGDAAEAFAALGISVVDANGNLRDSQTVFSEAVDALGAMENETERDAVAMKIFGRSAQELNPLIEAGSERLAALAEEAHNVGYVLDEETLGSMLDASDALDRIQKAAEGTRRRLVAAFAPTIASALERITPDLVELGESLTDVIGPAVDALANGIAFVSDGLNNMSDETRETVGRVAMLALALGPTVPLISQLANVAKIAAGAISAMISNPALAAIAAGALAIGGFALAIHNANEESRRLVESMADEMSAMSEYTEAENELLTGVRSRADALNAARTATDEAASSMVFQRDRAVDLVEELKNLADADGNVAESDQAHAQMIIDELANAYGIEIDLVNGQIQGYDTLTSSVYDVINAKTAEALLDRRRDDYLNALESEQGLLDAIATSQANADEALAVYNDALAEATRLGEIENGTNEERLAYLAEYGVTVEEAAEAARKAADEAHNNYLDSMTDLGDFNRQYLENARTIQNYDAAMLAAQEGNTDRVIDLMTGRVNAWHDYGDAVDAETAQALDDMYDEVIAAARYASEVRTNWENGVDGYTKTMVDEAENGFRSMLSAFDSAYTEATGIGNDFMAGLDNGLTSQLAGLKRTAEAIAGVIPDRMRGVLNIGSPSKVAEEIGGFFGEGLAIGLDRSTSEVIAAADDQAETLISAFSDTASILGGMNETAAALGGGSTSSVNYGGVNITVNASDEMSAREIAEAVMEQMQNAVARKEAVYA